MFFLIVRVKVDFGLCYNYGKDRIKASGKNRGKVSPALQKIMRVNVMSSGVLCQSANE